MIKVSIDVTKLDKSKFKKGARGTYCDLVLFERKNGPDEYGNAGFVKQDQTKEERESGSEMPILGNYKVIGGGAARPPAPARQVAPPVDEDSEIPF